MVKELKQQRQEIFLFCSAEELVLIILVYGRSLSGIMKTVLILVLYDSIRRYVKKISIIADEIR